MWIVQRPFTYEHWLSILCKLRNCCFILNRTILHIRENGRRNVRFFHLLRTFELVGNFPLADTEWGTGGTFSDSSSSQETQWLFYWLIPNKSILKCCNFCCASKPEDHFLLWTNHHVTWCLEKLNHFQTSTEKGRFASGFTSVTAGFATYCAYYNETQMLSYQFLLRLEGWVKLKETVKMSLEVL